MREIAKQPLGVWVLWSQPSQPATIPNGPCRRDSVRGAKVQGENKMSLRTTTTTNRDAQTRTDAVVINNQTLFDFGRC